MEETGPDALEVAAKAHEEGKKKENEAVDQEYKSLNRWVVFH